MHLNSRTITKLGKVQFYVRFCQCFIVKIANTIIVAYIYLVEVIEHEKQTT